MSDKERLYQLEKQIEFYVGFLFVEKEICDDPIVLDDLILRINDALLEVKQLKVI